MKRHKEKIAIQKVATIENVVPIVLQGIRSRKICCESVEKSSTP